MVAIFYADNNLEYCEKIIGYDHTSNHVFFQIRGRAFRKHTNIDSRICRYLKTKKLLLSVVALLV